MYSSKTHATAPASAVRVSRSPPRQPSAVMVTRVGDPAGGVDPAEPVDHLRSARRAGQRHRTARAGLALTALAAAGAWDNGRNRPGSHGCPPDRRRRGRGPGRAVKTGRPARVQAVSVLGTSHRFRCPRGDLNTETGAISPDRGNHAIRVTRAGRAHPGTPRSVRSLVHYLASAWLGRQAGICSTPVTTAASRLRGLGLAQPAGSGKARRRHHRASRGAKAVLKVCHRRPWIYRSQVVAG